MKLFHRISSACVLPDLASANYPELLRKMYVVNAPWIFNTFYWGLKQILPAR
jgi:hypothetical protein